MDKKKYLLISLTACSIMICLCLISETYAKYVTSATSTTKSSIARWKILVNEEDITLGATSESIITPVFLGNEHISSGVLAPNAEGYFDISLDASSVDVSFSYTISTEVNATSVVKELVVTGYTINGGALIEVANQATPIQGTMLLTEQNRTTDIRVYIKWDDSLDLMTNEEDTDSTKGAQTAKLDVKINVIQTEN